LWRHDRRSSEHYLTTAEEPFITFFFLKRQAGCQISEKHAVRQMVNSEISEATGGSKLRNRLRLRDHWTPCIHTKSRNSFQSVVSILYNTSPWIDPRQTSSVEFSKAFKCSIAMEHFFFFFYLIRRCKTLSNDTVDQLRIQKARLCIIWIATSPAPLWAELARCSRSAIVPGSSTCAAQVSSPPPRVPAISIYGSLTSLSVSIWSSLIRSSLFPGVERIAFEYRRVVIQAKPLWS
jgi:hypothetical protein